MDHEPPARYCVPRLTHNSLDLRHSAGSMIRVVSQILSRVACILTDTGDCMTSPQQRNRTHQCEKCKGGVEISTHDIDPYVGFWSIWSARWDRTPCCSFRGVCSEKLNLVVHIQRPFREPVSCNGGVIGRGSAGAFPKRPTENSGRSFDSERILFSVPLGERCLF